jgi:hypothetical protein
MRSHLEIWLISTCAAVAPLPPSLAITHAIRRAARRRRIRRAAVISLFDIIGVPRRG